MIDIAFRLLGGIGLFLLGMVLLTDGLKAYAGAALRRALIKFTGTPLKAFASGALVTALIQSSSAMTVTVIGFVSAGLLTFPQALGVVFGSSLGTTGTGWIVATLGLKVNLGFYALPLVGVGGLMKLLSRGRGGALGFAVAGFGLIFIGIDTLQEGMAGLAGSINLAKLPSSGFQGHLLAMLLGIGLTVLMQSSSAAVATTLAALHTGAVNFEQAASIVIGAAIGTTVTGAMAALGGTVPAKRTALAHVLFNLVTGIIVVVALPWVLEGVAWAQVNWGLEPGAMSLAAFHTTFVLVGVLFFLPWVRAFARMIERLLPDRGPRLTRHLDRSLLQTPAVALEATRRALCETASELFMALRGRLEGVALVPTDGVDSVEVGEALGTVHEFLAQVPAHSESGAPMATRVAQIHAIDHLQRLAARLTLREEVQRLLVHPRLQEARGLTLELLKMGEAVLLHRGEEGWEAKIERDSVALGGLRRELRAAILEETASGRSDPKASLALLDAVHWLDHAGYHSWRVVRYLGASGLNGGTVVPLLSVNGEHEEP
jgi:phosphate:Na+ symporter